MMDENVNILIGGDFVINRSGYSNKEISLDLIELFSESNLNIINLECPITSEKDDKKIIKTGPHLKGDEDATAEVMKALNVHLVTLANNHILDYGEKGLRETIKFCTRNNINTVGVGDNLKASQQTFRTTINGHNISVINISENEWSSAGLESAGAHPMNVIDNIDIIKKERLLSDKVILIIHGGHEYYNLPSPRMQKQYRFYADNGVDLIVGHHTHCISGFEIYNHVPIYYSLGNFLFTNTSKHEDWYFGLTLDIQFATNGDIKTTIHPIKQNKSTFELSLLKGEEKKAVLDRVLLYSDILKDKDKLETEWNKYVEHSSNIYLNHLSISSLFSNKYIKAVISKLGLKLFNKNSISMALNLMRCEAHSDMSKEVAQRYLKNK